MAQEIADIVAQLRQNFVERDRIWLATETAFDPVSEADLDRLALEATALFALLHQKQVRSVTEALALAQAALEFCENVDTHPAGRVVKHAIESANAVLGCDPPVANRRTFLY